MSELKHTPGNWKVIDGAIISDQLNEYGNWHILNLPVRPDGCENDQDKANANLIAAAPELLEALKEVFELLEDKQPDWYLRLHYNHIKSAITKTETN